MCPEVLGALTEGGKLTREAVGEYSLAVDAAPGPRPALLLDVRNEGRLRDQLVQREHITHLGSARVVATDALRVGHGTPDALPYAFLVRQNTDGIPQRLTHLGLAVEPLDPADLGDDGAGLRKVLAVSGVPFPGDVPREFQVLSLVLTHGHGVRSIDENVSRLENRVVEQSYGDRIVPLRFVLVLGHPFEITDRSHGIEEPSQLDVLGHVGLNEEGASLGIEANRQEADRHTQGPGRELGRVVLPENRVQIHDRVKALVFVLHVDPLSESPQVIAQVDLSRGLNPTEDPLPRRPLAGLVHRITYLPPQPK